MMSFGLNLSR
uniref:Uncharacterized protein n=1 Tax=Rhizophora mucronata TaxID=61149 RepID=A0A2P2NX90_RHIMU